MTGTYFIVVICNVVLSLGMFGMGQLHRRALNREKRLHGHIESLLGTIETYKGAIEQYKSAIAKLSREP